MRPTRFLAISAVGVADCRYPAVVAWAWAKTGQNLFVPQVRKKLLGDRRWDRIRGKFAGIVREIASLVFVFGGIDMVLVDVTKERKVDATSIALAHLIAGACRCAQIRFIHHRKWAAAIYGPEAALEEDTEQFDLRLADAIGAIFPSIRSKVTCPQPARAASLVYWAAARFGTRMKS